MYITGDIMILSIEEENKPSWNTINNQFELSYDGRRSKFTLDPLFHNYCITLENLQPEIFANNLTLTFLSVNDIFEEIFYNNTRYLLSNIVNKGQDKTLVTRFCIDADICEIYVVEDMKSLYFTGSVAGNKNIQDTCICDSRDLMFRGCICGQFQREQSLKQIKEDNSYHYL